MRSKRGGNVGLYYYRYVGADQDRLVQPLNGDV